MDLIEANKVLTFVVVLLVLLFLAATIVAIFTRRLLSWSEKWLGKWYSKIRKTLPEIMFAQEEMINELSKGISDSRKYSLTIWAYRIAAIIIASAAAFSLYWISGLHNILINLMD